MRTTIDLPDDLFRKVKSTAALRGQLLKDFIAHAIEAELSRRENPEARASRSPLPELIPAHIKVRLATREEIGNAIFGGVDTSEIFEAMEERGRRRSS